MSTGAQCLICKEMFSRVTDAHLRKHHVTKEMYLRRYPNAVFESTEWREHQSIGHLGQTAWNKNLTKETDARVEQYSLTISIHERTEAHKQHISEAKKGLPTVIAGWNKGLTKETNESVAKVANNKDRNQAISNKLKGRIITWGDKISKKRLEQLQNPEFSRKMFASFGNRPTRPELKLQEILDKHFPKQWAYGGDGSFVIAGKVPDFVNVDGKKQIIEVYGRYWHQNDDPQLRINYFKQFGFSTLVIWDDELNNTEAVIRQIKELPSVETLHETT